MPHSTAAEAQNTRISETEQTELEELLKAKLQAVPSYNLLPTLTLSDILEETPRAQHLPNIPPDIQLAVFLRHRHTSDQYGREPIKDKDVQSLGITRAIFFYRLNEARQFQRFHDTMRWNTAIFAALLALPSDGPPEAPYLVPGKKSNGGKMKRPPMSKDTYIPPAARRFIISYLAAVLEHHNTPTTFTARESFIKSWKSSVWDLFVSFGQTQKKLLKNVSKQLSKEWEEELDHAKHQMGKDKYEKKVARFVRSVVPGRKDQGIPAPLLQQKKDAAPKVGEGVPVSSHNDHVKFGESDRLLVALRVPFVARKMDLKTRDTQQPSKHMSETEAITVTDLRYAIAAAQKMKPCHMLPVLLKLFPAE
jgi:hypothetical protein